MDLLLLSQLTLGLLEKGFIAASGKIAEGALGKTGENLFSYLKGKLTTPAQSETLNSFVQNPNDDLGRQALLTQLQLALRADTTFQKELADMIPDAEREPIEQKIGKFNGNNNNAIQAVKSTVNVKQ